MTGNKQRSYEVKPVRNLCRPIQLNAVNIYDTSKLTTTREVIIFFK